MLVVPSFGVIPEDTTPHTKVVTGAVENRKENPGLIPALGKLALASY
jgi:hypothetical protein